MLRDLLQLVIYFLEMLISTVFFTSVSSRKDPAPIMLISGTAFFEVIAFINIFKIESVLLNALFLLAVNIIYSLVFFKLKPKTAAFYSLILVAVSTISEQITELFVLSISQAYLTVYKGSPIILAVEVLISKTLFFLIVLLFTHFLKKDSDSGKILPAFYIFPLTVLICAISFWRVGTQQLLLPKSQAILGIAGILLLTSTICVVFSFKTSAEKEGKLILLEKEKLKIDTDMAYYNILERQNNELMEFRHNMKHRLATIEALNTSPEIDAQLSKIVSELKKYDGVCHSGNRTLDVIIDRYVAECNINNILFEYDIKSNNLSSVDAYDLVAILGNLLDNAFEAANASTERFITLETSFKNDFTVIIINNSCPKTLKLLPNELPETTKKDKRLHGIGLKSVIKALKRHKGDIYFECENKVFTATAMLNPDITAKN